MNQQCSRHQIWYQQLAYWILCFKVQLTLAQFCYSLMSSYWYWMQQFLQMLVYQRQLSCLRSDLADLLNWPFSRQKLSQVGQWIGNLELKLIHLGLSKVQKQLSQVGYWIGNLELKLIHLSLSKVSKQLSRSGQWMGNLALKLIHLSLSKVSKQLSRAGQWMGKIALKLIHLGLSKVSKQQ